MTRTTSSADSTKLELVMWTTCKTDDNTRPHFTVCTAASDGRMQMSRCSKLLRRDDQDNVSTTMIDLIDDTNNKKNLNGCKNNQGNVQRRQHKLARQNRKMSVCVQTMRGGPAAIG